MVLISIFTYSADSPAGQWSHFGLNSETGTCIRFQAIHIQRAILNHNPARKQLVKTLWKQLNGKNINSLIASPSELLWASPLFSHGFWSPCLLCAVCHPPPTFSENGMYQLGWQSSIRSFTQDFYKRQASHVSTCFRPVIQSGQTNISRCAVWIVLSLRSPFKLLLFYILTLVKTLAVGSHFFYSSIVLGGQVHI